MTMSTQAPQHYESAVRAMSEAAAEAELTHAPVRLAYWRMAALDGVWTGRSDVSLPQNLVVTDVPVTCV